MRKVMFLIGCVGLIGSLSGCRSQKPPTPVSAPKVETPQAFTMSGTEALPERWWESLQDERLNALIEESMTGNFSLQTAWDRLRQAEQVALKAGSYLLPTVNYQVDGSRMRQETGANETYSSSVSAGLVASYEIDLWDRVRATREALVQDVVASQQDIAAAAVTLSASVAKTWYQLIEAHLQVALIEAQLQRNEQVLEIVTTQFRVSQVGASDVLRQRQVVQASQGQLIQAQEQFTLLQHRLCVLMGRAPQKAWPGLEANLIDLPPLPSTGVPVEILGQRPDVASAWASVVSADQRMAVAKADKYPSLSLTGRLNTSESHIEDLFDDWLVSLAASIAGPVFDANLRQAEFERTQAVLSQAIHGYQQVLVEAIQEVEDALVQESHQRDYVANLATQLDLAEKTYERTRQRNKKGQVDYLRVLDALELQQGLERTQLTAQRSLIERRIDLCRALAGAWDMERPDLAHLSE